MGLGISVNVLATQTFEIGDLGLEIYMTTPSVYSTKCNQIMCDYIENQLPEEKFFSECLSPGIWLDVPDNWNSW